MNDTDTAPTPADVTDEQGAAAPGENGGQASAAATSSGAAEPSADVPAAGATTVGAVEKTTTKPAPGDSVAEQKPVSIEKAPSGTPEGDEAAAEPAPAEFEMPSKWAIRKMVLLFVWRKIRVPLLAVVAIVAVVLAAIFGWKLKQSDDADDAAAAGLAAAKAYAVTLTSVDSGNLDHDFTAVLDGSTGEFKDMYTRSSGQLRQLLLDNKAAGKGTVLDAAVKSASPTKVEVLLFVDQTVTNSASADPRVDRSRVMMTMELVDGRWLASRVAIP